MCKIILTIISLLLFGIGWSQIPCSNAFEFDQKNKVDVKTDSVERIYLYGAAAIATSNNTSTSFTGVQRFAAKYVIASLDTANSGLGFRGLEAFVGLNLINLTPNAISVDSINFLSMMFPETGNTGVIVGPQITILNRKENKVTHSLKSEISGSLRQNKISLRVDENDTSSIQTTRTCDFTVLNINFIPVKYIFNYEAEENFKSWLSVSPYFNWLNIPNEDVENFNLLFSDPFFDGKKSNSVIPSWGVKLTGGINGLEFYIDARSNYNLNSLPDTNPFKGFVFTGGFVTNIQILAR